MRAVDVPRMRRSATPVAGAATDAVTRSRAGPWAASSPARPPDRPGRNVTSAVDSVGDARALQPSAARAVASPESVADAADSLDAVGNGAQFPPEAANHDVDRVAATVVTRAPYLAE